MTVTGITQAIPLSSRRHSRSGASRPIREHDAERFRHGSPGRTRRAARAASTPPASRRRIPHAGMLSAPFTDNPSVCTGEPLPVDARRRHLPGPDAPAHAGPQLPGDDRLRKRELRPGLQPRADDAPRPTRPPGSTSSCKAAQFLEGEAPSPSTLRSATLTLPAGPDRSTPTPPTARPPAPTRRPTSAPTAPAHCPDNSKIGTFDVDTPALDGPLDRLALHRRTEARQPVPGLHDLRRLRHPRQARRRRPARPADRPADDDASPTCRRSRSKSSTCTCSPPTAAWWRRRPAARSTRRDVDSRRPGTTRSRRSTRRRSSASRSGPNGSPCPGQVRPFNPRLVAGTSNPVAGDFSDFIAEARPRRRRPVPRRPQLQDAARLHRRPARDQLLPGGGDRRRRAERSAAPSRRSPSCPASSQIGTTNVAAGPGGHPFHAVGKMYLAGPVQGRAALGRRRSPRPSPAPTTTASSSSGSRSTSTRSTAQVIAVSDTVPIDHRRHPDPDALDPGQHRQAQLHDQPDQLLARSRSTRRGSATRARSPTSRSYFQVVNCAALPLQAEDDDPPARRPQGDQARSANPALQIDLRTRPGDANIKSLSVTLSNAFEIDQRHLGNICSEKELAEKQCAGRTPIGKATTTTPLLDQPLSGPVYAVSGSGGLPRLAFILNGQVNLRAPGRHEDGQRRPPEDDRPGRPRRADRPLPPDRLRRQDAATWSTPATSASSTPVIKVAYTAQNGKTRRQNGQGQDGLRQEGGKAKRRLQALTVRVAPISGRC